MFIYVQVIRLYHGHLSGVYCAALHPTLDILFTGSKDATVRVCMAHVVWCVVCGVWCVVYGK